MLVLTSILVPFCSKRFIPECLSFVVMCCIPILWSSWDLPQVFTINLMPDKLSIVLLTLSAWTSLLMTSLKPDNKFMTLNIILLLWSLLAFFCVSSLMLFFVFFEASLIPTLCLIMGWGYQPERLEASFYFIFYTITFSVPLLSSLYWLVYNIGSKYFYFDDLSMVCSSSLGLMMLLVFMIKLPLFMVHLWLPKAHVEAPVVGSMILAGVLLKTGGYGIVRVFLYMHKTFITLSLLTIGLIGMVYVCFVCLYCVDLKQMIAYSSVSHMNFMVVGLMNNSQIPYSGAIIMMVSHGLCSSLMFMLVDLSYKRCNSRSILINKGFLMSVPLLSLIWGFTILYNMGVPPTAGSISELMIISASNSLSMMFKFMFMLYLFLSAFYSMFIYICINHGYSNLVVYTLEVKELLLSFSHLVPLTGLTLMMKLMLV